MKYNIIHNNRKTSVAFSSKLIQILKSNNWEFDSNSFEYLFIIGGDGTFLAAACQYVHSDIKIVFINSGTLGFYSYIDKPEKLLFTEVLDDSLYTNLDCLHIQHNTKTYYCLNDFSIHSNYTSHIKQYVNDAFLQEINGNGILLCTPFGSTARNKSIGGPILFPETNVLALSEVEAINNKYFASLNSPIVINNNAQLMFDVNQKSKSWLLFDGTEIEISTNKYTIIVKSKKTKAKFLIKTSDKDYARKLNYAFIKADNGKH